MKKVKEFNCDNLKDIKSDIANALRAVSMKYGVELNLGTVNYYEDEFTVKISGSPKLTKNQKLRKKCIEWNSVKRNYSELQTMEINNRSNNDKFTFVGMKLSTKKNCFELQNNKNGKIYNTNYENMIELFG